MSSMDKKSVVLYVGNGDQRTTAKTLAYRNENQVYHWPDILPERLKSVILMRMKMADMKIPEGWMK